MNRWVEVAFLGIGAGIGAALLNVIGAFLGVIVAELVMNYRRK